MRWPDGKGAVAAARRRNHYGSLWTGPSADWIMDELELGRRVASRIGNENREGWGAWISPEIFEINLNPVVLQSDWTKDIDGTDPYLSRSPKRSGVRYPKPTADSPIFFPGQRQPSEPRSTGDKSR